MEYTTLGDSGLTVSRICLGCMSFGLSDWRNSKWILEETESRRIIERAIDLGINFFDTANVYSNGESERILGNVISDFNRDEFVLATKTNPRHSPESYPPTQAGSKSAAGRTGLSRKAMEQDLEGSLHRLGVETIDLYQTHRWDYGTPIKETLRALDDMVRRGKVRYIGGSSMWTHQFASALETSNQGSYERFVSMQNHYNLVYREEEREMLPLCSSKGVAVIPWSPLAGGYLTRPDNALLDTTRGKNMGQRRSGEKIETYRSNGGDVINDRVAELAVEKDATMAQISLAWLLHKDTVDAPIIGTTDIEHLEEAVEALCINLSDSEMRYLEEPYGPVEIYGHK